MKKIGLLALIIFHTSTISYAQSKAQKIDILMNAYHDLGQFNGAVLVEEHGKIIYQRGFGYANMEWKIKNEPDTKFLLGSLSKQFTAMLILVQFNIHW